MEMVWMTASGRKGTVAWAELLFLLLTQRRHLRIGKFDDYVPSELFALAPLPPTWNMGGGLTSD